MSEYEGQERKEIVVDPDRFPIEIEIPKSRWLRVLNTLLSDIRCQVAALSILGIIVTLWICGVNVDSPGLVAIAIISIAAIGIAAIGIMTKYFTGKENHEEKGRHSRAPAPARTAENQSHAG